MIQIGVGGRDRFGVGGEPVGLAFKAHRLLHHSTLGLRVINKKKKKTVVALEVSQT